MAEMLGVAGDPRIIGMCICDDMMFPETARALALAGDDIVFHSTMGGASLAGPEASFRARAAENFRLSGVRNAGV